MEQVIFSKFNFHEYDSNNTLVVIDSNIVHCTNLGNLKTLILQGGEQVKSFEMLELICNSIISNNIDVNGTLIVIGGGSIGDVAGLAASIMYRGIKLINVPTTMLAMIDSSVGGKNAINLGEIKNVIGAIKQADSIIIDTDYIDNLALINSAVGELVKYSLLLRTCNCNDNISEANNIDNTNKDDNTNNISDFKEFDSIKKDETIKQFDTVNTYMQQLLAGDFTNLQKVIEMCVYYKQSIVKKDLYGINERKRLNMGHTIGHAIELNSNIPHGQAVLAGLYIEALIGNILNITPLEIVEYIAKYYSKFSFVLPLIDNIIASCSFDKKNNNKKINFQLISSKYQISEVYIDKNELKHILNQITKVNK